jgi:hypothetical protein
LTILYRPLSETMAVASPEILSHSQSFGTTDHEDHKTSEFFQIPSVFPMNPPNPLWRNQLPPEVATRTPQTRRDTLAAQHRMAEVADRFPLALQLLAHLSKRQMLAMAAEICRAHGVPKPDRLARRQRVVLVCWFCQYGQLHDLPRIAELNGDAATAGGDFAIAEPQSPAAAEELGSLSIASLMAPDPASSGPGNWERPRLPPLSSILDDSGSVLRMRYSCGVAPLPDSSPAFF